MGDEFARHDSMFVYFLTQICQPLDHANASVQSIINRNTQLYKTNTLVFMFDNSSTKEWSSDDEECACRSERRPFS